jgi:hypothetical protein
MLHPRRQEREALESRNDSSCINAQKIIGRTVTRLANWYHSIDDTFVPTNALRRFWFICSCIESY